SKQWRGSKRQSRSSTNWRKKSQVTTSFTTRIKAAALNFCRLRGRSRHENGTEQKDKRSKSITNYLSELHSFALFLRRNLYRARMEFIQDRAYREKRPANQLSKKQSMGQ